MLKRLRWPVALVVVTGGLAGGFTGSQLTRPLPRPVERATVSTSITLPGVAPNLPWPRIGEAAIAVSGIGLVGVAGGNRPIPTASTAKIMTAYVILRDHPLALGASGPTLAITPAEVHRFQVEQAADDSVLPVAAGEHLTEYQLLEGLLLPSGDNVADILARWDAGSLPAFVAEMNATARALGMGATTYADASGLDPHTVSTPSDLIRIAEAALRLPVFAAIVDKTSAVLPVAGRVTNYNTLLGTDGIVGVKTGWTPSSGGVLVFAARQTVSGHPFVIVGAVMGQRRGYQLLTALTVSQHLVAAAEKALVVDHVLTARTVAGTLRVPWSPYPVPVLVPGLTLPGWTGLGGTLSIRWRPGGWRWPASAGTVVGHLTARFGTERVRLPLRLAHAVPAPSLRWRLTRPWPAVAP